MAKQSEKKKKCWNDSTVESQTLQKQMFNKSLPIGRNTKAPPKTAKLPIN